MAAKSGQKNRIDVLMDEASVALAEGRYFDAERVANVALGGAEQVSDYERMARILLPLQEARRQKRLAAIDTGRLTCLSDVQHDEVVLEAGCYLLEPMMVAAHGRDLRLRANEEKVPVLVVVREPKTQMGLWPICMIGPKTVRARVAPPAKGADDEPEPTIEWMVSASEALGNEAFAMVDPDGEAATRVKQISEVLSTCNEHEKLHQWLAEACREAAQLVPANSNSSR